MRLLLLLAVTIALGWGVFKLLGEDAVGPSTTHVPEPEATEEPTESPTARPVPRTVTLVMVVKTHAGHVPTGAVAGYEWGGRERVRPVDANGRVVFTDAPSGPLTLLARAPHHRPIEQRRYLTGGIPAEALLRLQPESDR